MWPLLIFSALSWGYNSLTSEHHTDNTPFDFQVGDYFNDLSQDSQTMLHQHKYYDKDNSTWGSERTAENTDNCWTSTPNCQPDYIHHIYYLPITEHKGYYYKITFSYNWHILEIKNTYTHG